MSVSVCQGGPLLIGSADVGERVTVVPGRRIGTVLSPWAGVADPGFDGPFPGAGSEMKLVVVGRPDQQVIVLPIEASRCPKARPAEANEAKKEKEA